MMAGDPHELISASTLFAGEDAARIGALLLDSIAAPEEGRRSAAVQWSVSLFSFDNVPARYVCVLAAGAQSCPTPYVLLHMGPNLKFACWTSPHTA